MFPIAAVEGDMVRDFAGSGATGEGVVGDAAGDDGAFGEVTDVLPAEGDAGLGRCGVLLLGVVDRPGSPGGGVPGVGVGVAEGVAGVALDGLAGEADAGEALGGGEDDAAVGVVPGVGFVLAHDGELDAVDGQELVEGEAEGHGGEDVDLDEGLAAGVVGAEGVLPSPFGGEGGEVVRQAGGLSGPGVGAECFDGARGFGNGGSTVGRGSGAGGRFVRGGRASRAMSRRLVGDDDGVSEPCRAGDGGTSGIGRGFPQWGGDDVAGRFIRGDRVSGITSRVPTGMRTGGDGGVAGHGSASGMIRDGRGRQWAVADFGPQVGVVAGQAAEA